MAMIQENEGQAPKKVKVKVKPVAKWTRKDQENKGQAPKKVKVKPVAKWTRKDQEIERMAPKKVKLARKRTSKDEVKISTPEKDEVRISTPRKNEENEGLRVPKKTKMVAELLRKDEVANEGKSPNKVKDVAKKARKDDEANEGKKSPQKVKVVAKRVFWKDEPEEDIPQNSIQVQPLSQKKKMAYGSQATFNDSLAMERAVEIQASLPSQFPSMIKGMLKSHVTRGFWLGLDCSFCAKHLPKEDTIMTLEDEDGQCSEAKYLFAKSGLSGGWRGFSLAHNLSVGDVVIFQLVNLTRFKVYISRANREEAVEGSLNPLKLNVKRKHTLVGNRGFAKKEPEDSDSQLPSGYSSQENNSADDDSYKGSDTDESEHYNGALGYDLGDGIRGCELNVDFSEVTSFAQFDILADGLVITPELSKGLQRKYYKLCCSRNCFLHQHLVPGLSLKTIAGLIADTVNVADKIRDSEPTTSPDEFAKWKTILDLLQRSGMDVGFLISHLDQLMSLADKSRRLEEAKAERSSALEELRSFETRTLETKERLRRLDEEALILEAGGPKLEILLQLKAKRSW